MKKYFSVSSVLLSFLASGCMSMSVKPDLVQRKAASDFSCPANAVEVEQVTDGNWKARGCEKEASYVCSGSNFMSEGTCLREGSM